MDGITRTTRRESYDAVIPKTAARRRLVLDTLGGRQMTASEIVAELVQAGEIPYYDRNYVAPRLTELKADGLIETVGRRRSGRSGKMEAVWRRMEVEKYGID